MFHVERPPYDDDRCNDYCLVYALHVPDDTSVSPPVTNVSHCPWPPMPRLVPGWTSCIPGAMAPVIPAMSFLMTPIALPSLPFRVVRAERRPTAGACPGGSLLPFLFFILRRCCKLDEYHRSRINGLQNGWKGGAIDEETKQPVCKYCTSAIGNWGAGVIQLVPHDAMSCPKAYHLHQVGISITTMPPPPGDGDGLCHSDADDRIVFDPPRPVGPVSGGGKFHGVFLLPAIGTGSILTLTRPCITIIMPPANRNAPDIRDQPARSHPSRYPQPAQGFITAMCRRARHGQCTSLACACPCGHGMARMDGPSIQNRQ